MQDFNLAAAVVVAIVKLTAMAIATIVKEASAQAVVAHTTGANQHIIYRQRRMIAER